MKTPNLRPVLEIYDDAATFWAGVRARTTFGEKKYMQWILERRELGHGVLDLGCGSGYPIADFFLQNGFSVTGVDGASAMIDLASKSYPAGEWIKADMRGLNLDRKFSAIVAWDSYFHLNFEDQLRMFPIFREHLMPKGALVFTSGSEHGEAIGDMNGEALFHASLSPAEYREALKVHGFDVVAFQPRDTSGVDRNVWLCHLCS